MERDYGKEIDYLKEQMENFQNTVSDYYHAWEPSFSHLRATLFSL